VVRDTPLEVYAKMADDAAAMPIPLDSHGRAFFFSKTTDDTILGALDRPGLLSAKRQAQYVGFHATESMQKDSMASRS
jgi:hypothetical protein